MQRFSWTWQGRPVQAAYEVLGTGMPVLLLPAFSTVSSREEMRPLASRLAASGFSCTLLDWPGFGASTSGRLGYGPALYERFLADFCAAAMPAIASAIAAVPAFNIVRIAPSSRDRGLVVMSVRRNAER